MLSWLAIITLCIGPMSQSSIALMDFAYPFMEFYQYIFSLLRGDTLKIRPVQSIIVCLQKKT